MPRYTDDQLHRALVALRASAAARNGPPVWTKVAAETGVGRRQLKRMWYAEHEDDGSDDEGPPATAGAAPAEPAPARVPLRLVSGGVGGGAQAPPPSGPGDSERAAETSSGVFDPLSTTALGYWSWRWIQVQGELVSCRSDIGRVQLLKMQDDIHTHLREELDRERNRTGSSPEQIVARLRDTISRMAPDHLDVIVEELRRRRVI
jgi:hypothetical protein